jgi:coenzyme F420-reducing hydrogenase delta subunit
VEYTRKLLEEIGLEGRRLQMINISSAMGGQFAWSAAELTEEIRQLGPNPLKDGDGVDQHSASKIIVEQAD